nr:hypothetical protein [Tanacetum cinerariifolium]
MNTPNDGFDTAHGKTSNGGTKPASFAFTFMDNTPKKMVQLYELSNKEMSEGDDVAIPLATIDEVSSRFVNTFYRYFIGKRIAFSIVENYVKTLGEVTRKQGKGKQNGNPRHIDGVRLTKPQPNYFYHAVRKPVNVNDEASTSQPKENKEASWQPKSDEDNGNPMDDLVDETRKKVEVPPKKTPRKTRIWSGRKADSSKRNVVFSPETKVHYFDRDDMEFDDMGQAAKGFGHEMPTSIMVDGFLMVISISCESIYFAS